MKRSYIGVAAASLLMLAACATAPSAPMQLQTPFNEADYAWSKAKGSNSINGNAVMRTVSGDAKTCAASQVLLIPSGDYTKERLIHGYGRWQAGYRPAHAGALVFANDPPAFHSLGRAATCDSLGNFVFTDLPDGEYHVLAQVIWGVPMQYYTSTEGGIIMQHVAVSGGEAKRVVLSQ